MLTMYMGDICLTSRLERVFPKKYSFSFTDELILKGFSYGYSYPECDSKQLFTVKLKIRY